MRAFTPPQLISKSQNAPLKQKFITQLKKKKVLRAFTPLKKNLHQQLQKIVRELIVGFQKSVKKIVYPP